MRPFARLAHLRWVPRLTEINVPPDTLARALAGEQSGQSAVYAALAPATFALIRRLTGGGALAEDLFQDTFVLVFQRLHAFRGEAPLGAWVRRIAVSRCLMYLRSPWHRARLRLRGESEGDAWHDALLPVAPAASQEETVDVERALASLSPTARAVVWLFEVEGYSHEEIAQLFGRSSSFSKSQLARAHLKLREWFQPRVDRHTCPTI